MWSDNVKTRAGITTLGQKRYSRTSQWYFYCVLQILPGYQQCQI